MKMCAASAKQIQWFMKMLINDSVNTPNLKQDQSRIIKPPVYTQQVSYHSVNHGVVRGYKPRSIHPLIV